MIRLRFNNIRFPVQVVGSEIDVDGSMAINAVVLDNHVTKGQLSFTVGVRITDNWVRLSSLAITWNFSMYLCNTRQQVCFEVQDEILGKQVSHYCAPRPQCTK